MMQALALRLCAARALAGATLAEERVFDSAIDPQAASLSSAAAPVIMVSTEQDEATADGRDICAAENKVTLLIEIALAGKAVVRSQDGQSESIFVPSSDARIEIVLDCVRRQAVRALTVDGGVWGDLFRQVVIRFNTIKSRRGAGDESGARFASRMVMIECETLAEPAFGAPPTGFWSDFVAQIAADPDTAPLAEQIMAMIEGETMASWRQAAATLGISLEVADAIGLPAAEPVVVGAGELEGGLEVVAPWGPSG